jgi:hypothetical protein
MRVLISKNFASGVDMLIEAAASVFLRSDVIKKL